MGFGISLQVASLVVLSFFSTLTVIILIAKQAILLPVNRS